MLSQTYIKIFFLALVRAPGKALFKTVAVEVLVLYKDEWGL
jgi:hypothetical protein